MQITLNDAAAIIGCSPNTLRARVQDALLGEFLSHTLYMRQCPESFRVTAPFMRVKRGLGKAGADEATRAVAQLLRRVAMAKRESEENSV